MDKVRENIEQIKKENFPMEYIPFQELILCGNTLKNVKAIILDKGFAPILIGKNPINHSPLVWLRARDNYGIVKLVEKNNSLTNLIFINNYSNDKQLDFVLEDKGKKYILLQIEYNQDIPKITKIDLKPLGYNIFGDENSLNIGNSKMSSNTFQAETLFSF